MKTYRLNIMIQVAIVGAALLAVSCSNEPTTPSERQPAFAPLYEVKSPTRPTGRYIVILVDSATNAGGTADRLATARRWAVRHVYNYALRGFSVTLPLQAIDVLRADPAVKYVQEVGDGEYQLVGTDPSEVNPPLGLDRIDARSGLDARYGYYETGSGVHVYIIDSGIRTTHTDFGGRATVGFDANPQDGQNGQDCNGHGTHVAGTVGGQTYGVAKGVSLVSVRVGHGCGSLVDIDDLIAGIDWVAGHRVLPAVANASIGGPANMTVDTAVNNTVSGGIPLVVAAGNNNPGADACNFSPARAAQAITVGATIPSTDARANFSNFGTCLDIFAPGVTILSDWATSNTATKTDTGTSMAAPHVAGTIARYLQYKPTATPSDVASAITSRATQGALTNLGTGSPNLLLYSWFVDASISGPTSIPACNTYTWSASASGIGSSFTFVWEYGVTTFPGQVFWTQVGTGPSYSRSVCPGHEIFWLRTTATNEFGHHRQASIYVPN